MTSTTRGRRGRVLAAGVIATIGAGVYAGGAAAHEHSGTASPEFCDAFLAVETAFKEVPEEPAEIEAFVAERIAPNLPIITDNAPEPIAADVGTMVSTVEQVTSTGDFSAFETPEFSAASTNVYRSLEEGCGFPLVDVLGIDYAFGGVPQTLAAGPTTFLFTNGTQAGEAHMMAVVKLVDGVDLTLDEILALPDDESDQYVDVFGADLFAMPEMSDGTIVDLTPGRWAYVCFIPVGGTPEALEAAETGSTVLDESHLHFMEGMAGEFTVE